MNTKRFPMPHDYVEDEYPSSLPGCIGELKCDPLYLQAGCRVRRCCEQLCDELYGSVPETPNGAGRAVTV